MPKSLGTARSGSPWRWRTSREDELSTSVRIQRSAEGKYSQYACWPVKAGCFCRWAFWLNVDFDMLWRADVDASSCFYRWFSVWLYELIDLYLNFICKMKLKRSARRRLSFQSVKPFLLIWDFSCRINTILAWYHHRKASGCASSAQSTHHQVVLNLKMMSRSPPFSFLFHVSHLFA